MTLEQLLAQTPEKLRPIVAQYGPALVKMTADEFCAWLDLLLRGRTDEAMAQAVKGLGNAELLAEWDALIGRWDAANEANARRVELQRTVADAVLKVLLMAALAAVGL